MNLIIELPRLPEDGETIHRLNKHIRRVQQYASVANKVYVAGSDHNRYWSEWASYFNAQSGYYTTQHHWCGLCINDNDSGKPVHATTRIVSNDSSIFDHYCRCKRDHISFFQSAKRQEPRWTRSMSGYTLPKVLERLGIQHHPYVEAQTRRFTTYQRRPRAL